MFQDILTIYTIFQIYLNILNPMICKMANVGQLDLQYDMIYSAFRNYIMKSDAMYYGKLWKVSCIENVSSGVTSCLLHSVANQIALNNILHFFLHRIWFWTITTQLISLKFQWFFTFTDNWQIQIMTSMLPLEPRHCIQYRATCDLPLIRHKLQVGNLNQQRTC